MEHAPTIVLRIVAPHRFGHGRTIVNVGSVGQPRDGNPRAAYLIIDPKRERITFRRCAYSIRLARRAVWHQMRTAVAPHLLWDLVDRLSAAI